MKLTKQNIKDLKALVEYCMDDREREDFVENVCDEDDDEIDKAVACPKETRRRRHAYACAYRLSESLCKRR